MRSDTVVKLLLNFDEKVLGRCFREAIASFFKLNAKTIEFEVFELAFNVLDHHRWERLAAVHSLFGSKLTNPRVFFSVKDITTSDREVLLTHQFEFDRVLDLFDFDTIFASHFGKLANDLCGHLID